MVNQTISVEELETQFLSLVDQLDELREQSARVGLATQKTINDLTKHVNQLRQTALSLEQQVSEKNLKHSLHVSQIEEAEHASLYDKEISIPKSQLKLFWDHLRLKVTPDPLGGVQVCLSGFSLPDLRFTLRYHESQYVISECDPLIIGLAELVDQLNADTQSGALARFICRIRARYTAQYSNEF